MSKESGFHNELKKIYQLNDGPDKRQTLMDLHNKHRFKLDHCFSYYDCKDIDDTIEATLKLLMDNFDVGHKESYIAEIISCGMYAVMEQFTPEGEL